MRKSTYKSIFLTLIFLLAVVSAFAQGGSIVRKASTTVMNPNGDNYISGLPPSFNTPFSNDGYYVDEFEITMFGLPKIGDGDVEGDNRGTRCGITDLIPDSLNATTLGYSVYAKRLVNNKLMFRFRVGDDNSSVESWSILVDTDGLFGPKPVAEGGEGPNYTSDNPGFELDITLIKRNNAGVYVYNIAGIDNCPKELLFFPIQSHFQISLDGGGGTCGDPDYYYDYYVPIDSVVNEFNAATGSNISTGSSLRYAAVTNQSASCAMGGTLSDVSGLDNSDPLYAGNFAQAFLDIIDSQCGTPIDSLIEGAAGFDANKVSPPDIDEIPPILEGQDSIWGTTVESNIWVELKIYTKNVGSKTWPQDSALARETHHAYSSGPTGTTWGFKLDDPLQAYDSIVGRTALTKDAAPCGSSGSNTSSTSVTIADPNKKPVAYEQNLFTPEETQLSIVLTGSDPDGNAFTFTIVPNSGPTHGGILGSGANWTYTPFDDYNGPDSFSFTVTEETNAHLDSTNVINITVTPVNDPPVVTGTTGSIAYTVVQSSIIIDNAIGITDVDDIYILKSAALKKTEPKKFLK